MRSINLRKGISALECLEEIKKVFFPSDETRENYKFQLADFTCKPIDLQDTFSPEDYKRQYNLHSPRLFILYRLIQGVSKKTQPLNIHFVFKHDRFVCSVVSCTIISLADMTTVLAVQYD